MQFHYGRGVRSSGCARRHSDSGEELCSRSLKGGDHTQVEVVRKQGLCAIMVGTDGGA